MANLANTKWCKDPEKWPKPWHMGTHLRVLGESYPMNTNMTWFRWFSKNFVLWMKVALALEELKGLASPAWEGEDPAKVTGSSCCLCCHFPRAEVMLYSILTFHNMPVISYEQHMSLLSHKYTHACRWKTVFMWEAAALISISLFLPRDASAGFQTFSNSTRLSRNE